MVAVAGAPPVVGAAVVFVVVDAVVLAVAAVSLAVLLFAGAQAKTASASAAQMRFFTRPPSGARMLCDVAESGNHGRSGLLTPALAAVVRMVMSPSSA